VLFELDFTARCYISLAETPSCSRILSRTC
jgi:hypothetical protein